MTDGPRPPWPRPRTPEDHARVLFQGGGELGRRMLAVDWSKTPLGTVEEWPQNLRSAVGICIGSRFPIAIYWGPSLTLLYNDAWSPIPGGKHPWALGRDAREVWPEIWNTIGPLFEHVMTTGESTYSEDALLPMHRHGYTEECYFNFTFTPIRGVGGAVDGIFNAVVETTFRVISERRTRVLRDLGERIATVRSPEEACALAAGSLAQATRDIPFCSVYLVSDDGATARLAGCAGFPPGGPATPETISLRGGNHPWSLADIKATSGVSIVGDLQRKLGFALPGGEWPEPADAALISPLATAGRVAGFLILGVNPRRAVDEEYLRFAEHASSLVAGVLGNAQAFEDERRRAAALAEISRAKTAFFSNVSHEFRTPLTLMLGPQEDALASPDGALAGEDLRAVHRNTLRLLKLVNTLLDFSRMEAGSAQAAYAPTDLSALTLDLTAAFRSAIERAGLTFEVDCPGLPEPVHVDRDMWEKIVLNLLSNALKFTFEGSVGVALRLVGGHVELEVRDTGVGIPERELPRLFERFHRIEGSRSRTHEGSGIGLSLVNDLVKLHGGTIRLTSRPGHGTTFVISMPTGTAHLPPDRLDVSGAARSKDAAQAEAYVSEALRWLPDGPGEQPAPATPSEVAASTSEAEPRPEPARVLVADDNADMRDYVVRLLRKRWTVVAVADGALALSEAREHHPDLILSDVMMPNLDGFGLLRALRNDPRTAAIPVIMLSARAGDESRLDGLEAGADDYLVKPFSARELVARVETHLKLAKARGEGERQWRRLLGLLDQMPTPISILRLPERRYEFSNRAHARVAGHSVAGKTLEEAYPDLVDKSGWAVFDEIAATKQALVSREVPTHLRRGDGKMEARYLTSVMQPWIDEDGTVAGVLTVSFDVTEEVIGRRDLEAARREAETATRAKDEFLAMLGHELRNPLSPIATATQLMRMRGTEGRELSIIERQVSHLVRLVDDLLDVSRITRGKIDLRNDRFELGGVVLRGIEQASPLMEHRRQALKVDVPAEGLPVEGDADRLAQVVSNLLTNASKYSDPGSSIHLRAARAGKRVRLSVVDHGIGIAPDMLSRIFDLFVQQPQAIDRAKGGLGLGLAIVRSLVDLHGGTVQARSEGVGKGSEFIVEFPLAAGAEEIDNIGRWETSARLPAPIAAARGKRILVVDDNQDAAEIMAELLSGLGHEVRSAYDGPTAVDLARTFRPDVCLLDIGLPVMDGYDLAKALRRVPELPRDLRLVAVTGYGQDADRQRSLEAGFDVHVVKPVNFELLSAVLHD
jgi:signal transduction histidine kinase/response regulator of citrate/malate metabolism